uniref:Uncharacterized protein n=1 Tax=Plectus sambesii TaxID=2011161 RepID=A0A914VF03_9BILA
GGRVRRVVATQHKDDEQLAEILSRSYHLAFTASLSRPIRNRLRRLSDISSSLQNGSSRGSLWCWAQNGEMRESETSRSRPNMMTTR